MFALLSFLFFFSLVPLLHQLFRLASSHSLTRCNCVGGCLAWLVDWLHVILMLNGYRLAQWSITATGSRRSRTLLFCISVSLFFCSNSELPVDICLVSSPAASVCFVSLFYFYRACLVNLIMACVQQMC